MTKEIKKELNKWQFVFSFGKSGIFYNGLVIIIGIFNIQFFPDYGNSLVDSSKKYYKGFLIDFHFIHPLAKLKHYLEKKGY